jgi:hypothetical protein
VADATPRDRRPNLEHVMISFDDFEDAMSGTTTVANAWTFFAKHALPPGCSDIQRDDMYFAFWSGCATVFSKIGEIMNGDPAGQLAGLTALAEEIAAMALTVERAQQALAQQAMADAMPDDMGMHPVLPNGQVVGRIVKIDSDTGEEVYASPEENRKVLEMMRQALDNVEGGVVFSEEAAAKLRERGVSEDQITMMLAEAVGRKQ